MLATLRIIHRLQCNDRSSPRTQKRKPQNAQNLPHKFERRGEDCCGGGGGEEKVMC